MSEQSWLEYFACPPAEFRPVPFWSWNERMEPAEVRRQVDEIAAAGWGGGFLHSRVGLTTPYLGEEWFAACAAAIDQCKQRGLKVFLYDEDKWPSGYSGGTVPMADESFRQKILIARPVGTPVPPEAVALGEPHDGLQVYSYTVPLKDPWFNGTSYADTMSKAAMRKFVHDAYAAYYERFSADYGETIIAEFTDEPNAMFARRLPLGPVVYSADLTSRFEEIHGYDPVPLLHLLFTDAPEGPRFRLHYYRTINNLFETNFSRQLGDWCAEHGIALTGHYMAEEHLYEQQRWGVKLMANYRFEGFPGIDLLGRQVNQRIGPKMCHSVVNQYGKPRMLSEFYGCTGGALTFEDRHWMAGMQLALGVTLINPHLSLYTMAGCRKRDYPQNMFYPQPWWPLNHLCDDPLSRTCVALSQGQYVADALVIHPQESVLALWQVHAPTENGERAYPYEEEPTAPGVRDQINELDASAKAAMEALLGAQRTMDFGDETILADDGAVEIGIAGPRLRVGKMLYPAVIIPAMRTMAATTLKLLQEFQAAGGPIWRCGRAAEWLDGEPSAELAEWLKSLPEVSPEELPRVLAEVVPAAVEVTGVETESDWPLLAHVRDVDGGRIVYLANLHRERGFTATVGFRTERSALHLLDTETGQPRLLATERTADGLQLRVPFAPGQSWLFLLRDDQADGGGASLLPPPTVSEIALPAEAWQVERLDDNAFTLDYAYWREGDGEWSPRPLPVIAIQQRLNDLQYEGRLTLRYPVQVQGLSPQRQLRLVVEYPERYSISVNGQPVAYAGLPSWRDFRWMPIDATGMLTEGGNTIELHCEHFIPGDLTSLEDAFRRYGTEIESLYLVGDFGVIGEPTDEKTLQFVWEQYGLPRQGVQCFAANTFILTDPQALVWGDTTLQGLPFYAGRLRYTVNVPELPAPARLQLGQLDCPIAEVSLDGVTAGHIYKQPLQLELSPGEARQIEITLYGTLRNLLGPHHHPHGELAAVGPPHFAAATDTGEPVAVWVAEWAQGQSVPTQWRDRYCMVTFGELGEVRLLLSQ
ncbi:MAG: hypothetical protein ABFE08_02020 [Armatimonadia bacterium]